MAGLPSRQMYEGDMAPVTLPSWQGSNLAMSQMHEQGLLHVSLCSCLTAGELYTSNCAYMPAALFEGRCNFFQLWRNWILSFFGNLAGSLIVVWLVDEVSTQIFSLVSKLPGLELSCSLMKSQA